MWAWCPPATPRRGARKADDPLVKALVEVLASVTDFVVLQRGRVLHLKKRS